MPIYGKTAFEGEVVERRDLQVVYRLWKGEAKTEGMSGIDLKDRFRFEGNDDLRKKFIGFYGSDRPTQLRIYLPYNDVDQVFETWGEAYTAQGFKHRCNGQRIFQEMRKCPRQVKVKKAMETHYSFQRMECDRPCQKDVSGICQDPDCKDQGKFFFYIREFYSQGLGSSKCGMMTVTGKHDVPEFHSQLSGLQKRYGGLRGSPFPVPETFGYIPYILSRVEKTIFRPAFPGAEHRVKGKTWVLSISEDPEWLMQLQQYYQQQEIIRLQGIPQQARLMAQPQPIKQLAPASQQSERTSVQTVKARPVQKDDDLPPANRQAVMKIIDQELGRLNWSTQSAVSYLLVTYKVKSRSKLSDDDLLEFCMYLKSQPTPTDYGDDAPEVEEGELIGENDDAITAGDVEI